MFATFIVTLKLKRMQKPVPRKRAFFARAASHIAS
jgi:hypothetical protein